MPPETRLILGDEIRKPGEEKCGLSDLQQRDRWWLRTNYVQYGRFWTILYPQMRIFGWSITLFFRIIFFTKENRHILTNGILSILTRSSEIKRLMMNVTPDPSYAPY